MYKVKFLFYLIYLFFLYQPAFSYENIIIYKIDNEIITSYDIKKEVKYLISMNTNLSSLEENEILKLATQSIIKEKIKIIELKKYYSLGENTNNKIVTQVTSEIYRGLGIKNEEEFMVYLSTFNIQIDWVKEKFEIESLWNDLIYRKYENQILIDRDKIKEQVSKEFKTKKRNKRLFLSEILIKLTKESDQLILITEVKKKIGFGNVANTYSISKTANKGGRIGWVNESSLSSMIVKEIKNLKKGEITIPIKLTSGFLILKVNDIEINEIKVNLEKITDSRINNELNKQLDQFSTLYFNKTKTNTKIDAQK